MNTPELVEYVRAHGKMVAPRFEECGDAESGPDLMQVEGGYKRLGPFRLMEHEGEVILYMEKGRHQNEVVLVDTTHPTSF